MVNRLAPLIALVLAGCTAAPAREAGRAPSAPLRVVSLNPCTDAILAEVADPVQIAALSYYSRDPASSSMDLAVARRFASTGDSVEEVAALRPDVVVGGTFIAPATRSAFDRMGLRYAAFGIAPTVADSKKQVRQLAALVGHPERGAALNVRIDAALAAAAAPGAAPVPALVWQSGGIVPGPDTLVADVLGRTGFANAAAALGLRQADMLPLEAVLADPPRVILAAGNTAGNEDRLLRHPALRRLSGTTTARLDPALLWCGGPTIVRLAGRLAEVRRAL